MATAAAFHPDGQRFAAAGGESRAEVIGIWNQRTRNAPQSIPTRKELTRLVFAPDGATLYADRDKADEVAAFDVDGSNHRCFRLRGSSFSIAISPDGRELLRCMYRDREDQIEILNTMTGDRIGWRWDLPPCASFCGQYMPGGDRCVIAMGGIGQSRPGVRYIDRTSCEDLLVRPYFLGSVEDIAVSDDGQFIAVAGMEEEIDRRGFHTIAVFNADLHLKTKLYLDDATPRPGELVRPSCVRFLPKSHRLVAGGHEGFGFGAEPGRVRIWDIDSGDLLLTQDFDNAVKSLAVSPIDQRVAIVEARSKSVRTYDMVNYYQWPK